MSNLVNFNLCGRISCIAIVVPFITMAICGCADNSKTKHTALPIPVKVAEVIRKDVPVEIKTFGTIEPSTSVIIQSQVTGILTDIKFSEGDNVRKGAILFLIDPTPFKIEIRQAEASLARNRVLHENAKKETQRQEELLSKGLTSRDMYDQAKAASDALAASIKSDEATVENAKVRLGYCTIKTPIDGRTGKHIVDTGNLVKANDTVLGTINSIKPIEASFSVPEQFFGEISRRMKAGKVTVRAMLLDQPDKYEEGMLSFIDNSIDRETGTIAIKATFPNKDERLWPGGFTKLVIVLFVEQNAIIVPSESVMSGQKGTYVFIARADNTAEFRLVKVARSMDDYAVIAEGLAPSERVIIEGQHRTGPGSRIEIKNPSATNATSKP